MTLETVHVVAWRLYDYLGEKVTYGGAQRWLVELTRLLRSLGHQVVVHQRAQRAFVKEFEPGVIVRGYPAAARAVATPWFCWQAHRAIPSGAPVVYMAEDLAHPICRPRSLVIQHGIWWDGEYGWLRTRLAEHLAHHAVTRSAGVVCVDTNFMNWFRARWPQAGVDRKLHYVANFIDAQQWGPRPTVPACTMPGRVTICFPRRSEPRRGIWLMAEIAPRLATRFPQVDFRFVVGSGYFTERLREKLAASGLDSTRWTLEVRAMDEMREAYEKSQIVVIPTVCGEGTSLSAIEAMHFGCAIVSTWVGGLANLIQDGENGLLVAPVADQVEAALARLLVDVAERKRLGTAAMAMADRYGIARWRERIRAVLADAIQVGSPEPALHGA